MKFVRLGDVVINTSQIQAIKKVSSSKCVVYMIDESTYNIEYLREEEIENALTYLCLGGEKSE